MKYIIIIILLFFIQEKPLKAQSIQYRYDNAGRLMQVIYSNQATINYTYDDDGNRISAVTSSVALPVELLTFIAQKQNSQVLLTWSTSQEINSDKFDVEFSKDGITFQSFTSVAAKGTSWVIANYSTLHCCPTLGANYYRLKMIDRDGSFKYSGVRKILFEFINSITVFPNPAAGKEFLNISFAKPFTKDATINIYNSGGALIYSTVLSNGQILAKINIGTYSAASYYIVVTVGAEEYKEKFIKQ